MHRRRGLDLRLYLVAGPADCTGRSLTDVVEQAVEGGVTVVQLRDKDASTRQLLAVAGELLEMLRPRGVPLLLNDRADVALAVGAAGVHVGQHDLPPAAARRLLGARAVVGLTADTPQQVEAARSEDVDYLGVGPVLPTPTKADVGRAWGVEGFRRLGRRAPHPVVAIGGVTSDVAGDVVRAGADGVAVVSAVCAAEDPRAAARRLRDEVDRALAERAPSP